MQYLCENKQNSYYKENKYFFSFREFQNQIIWTLRYKGDIYFFVSVFKDKVASRQVYLSSVW